MTISLSAPVRQRIPQGGDRGRRPMNEMKPIRDRLRSEDVAAISRS